MDDQQAELGHRVTPLELFFDLVFVFAITQVTSFLSRNPTWGGLLRGRCCSACSGGPGPRMHG
jgi:low temperature requirement protein LtrA